MKIPFLDMHAPYQELKSDLDAAYQRVMDSGWYILGGEVEAFEQQWAEFVGAKHCIGVANGLDALELMLRACGVGPGDEVIVPANTYIATWLAISSVGATPLPVEPDAATFNLDPARLEAAITPKTRAIMPVHLYGQPADMTGINAVAARHGLPVLEDAAQAHGAKHHGKRAGALGTAAGWSFYPGKNLGALGDAGGVTTNDDQIADRVRVLRNYGSRVKYYNEVIGMNSRLDTLQAAMLAVKVPHLDDWNARRQRLAVRYLSGLSGTHGLTLPAIGEGNDHIWHLFVVRHAQRDALQKTLTEAGIGTLIHYPVPPHLSGAYTDWNARKGEYPITEDLANTVLSLPMGPHLAEDAVDAVIEAVRAFCGR